MLKENICGVSPRGRRSFVSLTVDGIEECSIPKPQSVPFTQDKEKQMQSDEY